MRGLAWVLVLAAVGCDDDGGSDGAGGAGGVADMGGAGAAGGEGGAGGGAGGEGGAGAAGGAGGEGGVGGAGGAGGAGGVGGAGGAGGAGGVGGAGGAGGAGGMGGMPGEPAFCQEACEQDPDCLQGFVCRERRCVPAEQISLACEDDLKCVAQFSGWTQACENDAGCMMGFACVAVNGGGLCAFLPSDALPCTTLTLEAFSLPRFGGEGEVSVCANARAECGDDGNCRLPCRNDGHCGGDYPSCNVDTGVCRCTENSCTTNASVCGEDGICRCAGNADCTQGADTCFDGFCGCSSAAICMPSGLNPGTTPVCEPFPGQN